MVVKVDGENPISIPKYNAEESEGCIGYGSNEEKIMQAINFYKGEETGIVVEKDNMDVSIFSEQYDQTPSAQLIGSSMSASINTDIKGFVGTSLSNEYAIVRLALLKSGKIAAEVDAYLKKMADESIGHRFLANKSLVLRK